MIANYLSDILNVLSYNSKQPLLFNSGLFLLLFLVFYGGYIFFRKSSYFKLLYVIAFSLFFYYKYSGFYFILLVFSSIVDYVISLYLYKSNNDVHRKLWVTLSVVINLGLLGYFKYTHFFIDNINVLFDSHLSYTAIFLPIGISFYTFQTMSYTIDVYRKTLKPSQSFIHFLFFVSFFPQLVAGPIVRAAQFLPQITKNKILTTYELDKALLLIMGGLLKKVVISDYISINFVDRVFDTPQLYSSLENLLAVYGYAVQIYCDFSGYSDMAIGLALLMGFRLPANFRSPYQSKSITEFWRRWHISLSSWLRDYLYISLGGNRKGQRRTYINLFLVMFLGGLWHGASWNFVFWGCLHGVILGVERFAKSYITIPKSKVLAVIKWIATFHFVVFAWIFFRAESFEKASLIINNIGELCNSTDTVLGILSGYKYVLSLMLISLTLHLLPNPYFFKGYKLYKIMPTSVKILILSLVLLLTYLFTNSAVQPFIYFQF